MEDRHDDGRWADWRSTVALTGIAPPDLAWAMSRGQVDYSLTMAGHEGVPMIRVDDVELLMATEHRPTRLRIVRDTR